MASRIVVKVSGPIGLDDAEQLLAELARGTELEWREEPDPEPDHLGVAEFLLAAAVSGVASKAGEYAYAKAADGVRRIAARWSARRLDPLDVQVTLEGATVEGTPEDAAQGTPPGTVPHQAPAPAPDQAPAPAPAPGQPADPAPDQAPDPAPTEQR